MKTNKINEAQMIKIVEDATRRALKNILAEGVTWQTMKDGFKDGFTGEFEKFTDDDVEDYVQNGDGINYERYRQNKADYKKHKKMKGADPITTNRFAYRAVEQRPGLLGRAGRRAAVTAAKAGKGLRKMKNGVTDFVHNRIGLEEDK